MTGLELKQYRLERGISQGALAQDIGCSERSILTYEGKARDPVPRWIEWYALAHRAGLRLDEPETV